MRRNSLTRQRIGAFECNMNGVGLRVSIKWGKEKQQETGRQRDNMLVNNAMWPKSKHWLATWKCIKQL